MSNYFKEREEQQMAGTPEVLLVMRLFAAGEVNVAVARAGVEACRHRPVVTRSELRESRPTCIVAAGYARPQSPTA